MLNEAKSSRLMPRPNIQGKGEGRGQKFDAEAKFQDAAHEK